MFMSFHLCNTPVLRSANYSRRSYATWNTIFPEEVTTDPEKFMAVQKWPPPKDRHELRSFRGVCICYQMIIC
jgi:hypothetical protein